MENEYQKMQRLAGVPVTEDKKSLNENFVGLPMVGNIFDRPKADYELAYEHYLGKVNENEIKEELSDSDTIYNTLMTMGLEELVSALMSAGEEEPRLSLEDFLNGYAYKTSNLKEEMEGENPIDAISMDVPLFIRMLEFAREDASTDMDLHDVAEKAIAMSAEGGVLSMDNYEDLVSGETEIEEEI